VKESRDGRRRSGTSRADTEQRVLTIEEAIADLTEEELREFLQGDILDVPVDPRFKERLKRKLWKLVQEQMAGRKPDPDPDA